MGLSHLFSTRSPPIPCEISSVERFDNSPCRALPMLRQSTDWLHHLYYSMSKNAVFFNFTAQSKVHEVNFNY